MCSYLQSNIFVSTQYKHVANIFKVSIKHYILAKDTNCMGKYV